MKNLVLTISLVCCFGYDNALAQINLIEQFENNFSSETEETRAFVKPPHDFTKSNNAVTGMSLNEEGMMSDLIKTAREFESLKNEQLKNLNGNYETIETLNYALKAIQDLICAKMARGELCLNYVNELNMSCDNF